MVAHKYEDRTKIKNQYIRARVTSVQKQEIEEKAKASKQSVSEYIMNAINHNREHNTLHSQGNLQNIENTFRTASTKGNFDESQLEYFIDQLRQLSQQIADDLESNNESEFYIALLDYIVDHMQTSITDYNSKHSYNIPKD